MSAILYHPELNEVKPDTQIDATLSYSGKHWFLKTTLDLKGRGIKYLETIAQGVKRYEVTNRAFEILENQYTTSIKCYLD